MNKKVVITGLNIISSLGLNLEENWNNLTAGKSGVTAISLFDPINCETKIAAQVPSVFDAYAAQFCKKRMAHQMTRVTTMAFVCAAEAIGQSRIDFGAIDRKRCAVIMGAVSTGNSSVEQGTIARNRIIKCMTNAIPAWISLHY